jgi:hypothetical protein
MMRRLVVMVLLVAASFGAFAADKDRDTFAFMAWNPGAALSFVPTGFVFRSIIPVVLFNLESGVAVAGGFAADHQAFEARLSLGNSNATYFVAQAELGWSWFFAESGGKISKGPYAGASLRYWDLVQVSSLVQSHNLAPMVRVGWWFDFGKWFIDARFSQVFAVASASSIPGSTAAVQWLFSPLPGISPWMPIGLVQIGLKL